MLRQLRSSTIDEWIESIDDKDLNSVVCKLQERQFEHFEKRCDDYFVEKYGAINSKTVEYDLGNEHF